MLSIINKLEHPLAIMIVGYGISKFADLQYHSYKKLQDYLLSCNDLQGYSSHDHLPEEELWGRVSHEVRCTEYARTLNSFPDKYIVPFLPLISNAALPVAGVVVLTKMVKATNPGLYVLPDYN